MNKKLFAGSLLLIFSATAAGESMPSEERSVLRTFPEGQDLSKDTEYKRKYEEITQELNDLKKKAESAESALKEGVSPESGSSPSKPASADLPSSLPETQIPTGLPAEETPRETAPSFNQPKKKRAVSQGTYTPVPSSFGMRVASPVQVFATTNAAVTDETFTVLPTGSHVKAKVVSGVEANSKEPYPVLLQADYAFTGPNKTRIDLTNCFLIAMAKANMSTERVMMETDSISCVRDNGEHFKAKAKAFVAGEDNTFGATGTYISKRGQVLLAAVLANIAKNAGEAVSLAQQSTTIAGADKAATATNVTGSKAAFVAGKSVVDAGAMIAQWYLEQAKELLPSIGVGSGQDVHVIMLDSVRVPSLRAEE